MWQLSLPIQDARVAPFAHHICLSMPLFFRLNICGEVRLKYWTLTTQIQKVLDAARLKSSFMGHIMFDLPDENCYVSETTIKSVIMTQGVQNAIYGVSCKILKNRASPSKLGGRLATIIKRIFLGALLGQEGCSNERT